MKAIVKIFTNPETRRFDKRFSDDKGPWYVIFNKQSLVPGYKIITNEFRNEKISDYENEFKRTKDRSFLDQASYYKKAKGPFSNKQDAIKERDKLNQVPENNTQLYGVVSDNNEFSREGKYYKSTDSVKWKKQFSSDRDAIRYYNEKLNNKKYYLVAWDGTRWIDKN